MEKTDTSPERFYNIYDECISAHHDKLKTSKQMWFFKNFSLSESHTVHLNLGRRTAKTSYIIDRCEETDIIVVPNFQIRNLMMDVLEKKKKKVPVYSAEFIFKNPMCFSYMNFRCVWVDEPGLCFMDMKNKRDFYIAISEVNPAIVVMLGA